MYCTIKNRETLIQKYVLHQLKGKEREDFDRHLYDCRDCFHDVKMREKMIEVFSSSSENGLRRPGRTFSWSTWNRYIYIAAGLMLVLLFGGILYRTNLPEYYDLAHLTGAELEILMSVPRDATDGSEKEWRIGSKALSEAEGTKFLFFPNFNPNKTDTAVVHLAQALDSSSSEYKKNKYRYFLAKGYLMQGEESRARKTLEAIMSGNSDVFLREARTLYEELKRQ